MLDTLKCAWRGINFSPAFQDWLLEHYPRVQFSQGSYSGSQPWNGLYIQDAKLGVIGIKTGKQANVLTCERSIPSYLMGDNCGLLSADQVLDGASDWVAAVQARFAGWWQLPNYASTATIKRVDLCYQQPTANSGDVFAYIHAALSAKRTTLYEWLTVERGALTLEDAKIQRYLTGLTYRQNRHELARWYDKGVESGNEQFIGVVRHEEQIRGQKAGAVAAVLDGRVFVDRDLARNWMNGRYEGWGPLDVADLGPLLAAHGTQGAAAGLLIERPDYEPLLKQHLARSTFFRLKALAMAFRRCRVPVDLRVPLDAWREPLVY